MSLNLLLADDEPLARSRLRRLLGQCTEPAIGDVQEAASGEEALAHARAGSFDAALLDIHMPGMGGMELAAALRQIERPPAIIFVTAHSEHAVDAFELEALDYLTKPVRAERLQAALAKVQRARPAPAPAPAASDDAQHWLHINDRGNVLRVPISEVLYFQAELKYLTVRTATATHLLDATLGQLEQRFGEHFLRVHRNALVARRAIRALLRSADITEGDGWAVRLHGLDDELPVSRRQLAKVRAELDERKSGA